MDFLLSYTDLVAAILNFVMLVAIAAMVTRFHAWRFPIAWGLVAFFSIRVLSRLNDSPDVGFHADDTLEVALDLLSVAVLAYLLSQVGRTARLLVVLHDEARYRAEEYERARRHYVQVVRHRMFNPLTVIQGVAQTIRSGAVKAPVVVEGLCDSLIAMADELEQLTLEPERRDDLERELDAVPHVGVDPGGGRPDHARSDAPLRRT